MQETAQKSDVEVNLGEALRNSASCTVIIADSAREISKLTPDAAELTGVDSQVVLRDGVFALPDSLQKFFKKAAGSSAPISAEIKIAHPTRGPIKIFARSNPLTDNNGNPSGFAVSLQDFTQIEALEKHLHRIDRLASIGTLSASMAHEIKNALVAVRTFVDLLLSRNSQDELAGIVGREMSRIDSIVSQMLTFSSPAKPTLSPLHLHDVLNHSLRLVHHQIAKKNIRLERTFDASPDLVKGDDYQLKQAFLNLLFNALEAMSADGTLIVSTQLTDPRAQETGALRETNPTHVRVTIRDNGPGIAGENLDRVFEPFFTTKTKGTGLGLPITKRIIREHRATISVASQPGNGAEFSILFPLPNNSY